jgi:hypothetical protein
VKKDITSELFFDVDLIGVKIPNKNKNCRIRINLPILVGIFASKLKMECTD